MRLVTALAVAIALACAAGPAAARCRLSAPDAARAGSGCAQAWMDRNLRMNDILTVGVHNSYKQAIAPKLFALLTAAAPKAAPTLDYQHPPLAEQLDDGARALELDLVYDPQGGRFAHPVGMKMAGLPVPDDYVAAMSRPGIKVLHVQDVDFRSSCLAFVDCLRIIRAWSLAHPRHAPILITMNTNDEPAHFPGGVAELPFDAKAYDAVDAEIASVFPRSALITPDEVQGPYSTLREAVLKHGWPRLGEARGKVMFALDEEAPHVAAYRGARRSLEGRLLFVNTDEASPAAGYITLNEHADTARITADVKAGFIVRTRADADTLEARTNDTARRDAALVSGAQYVSTDYRHPDARFSSYQVRLPGEAVAVCNPVRAPKACAGIPIEP
ncbi:MAG: phosphatidylinositol-specific phospholipase C1-like protein [Caulobacteraceae bacterium]|nr:phosphatidylinositol-specific phospholipase C1-like protein [Caulobacteraceae bacterium]